MIGIEFSKHFHQKKIVEKNVWFFFPDFRKVILKVFPGSKRAEIATIRLVTPELCRLYFLGAKKSWKFIKIEHFQNLPILRFLTPRWIFPHIGFLTLDHILKHWEPKKRGHLVFSTFFGIFSGHTLHNPPRALVSLGAIFLGSSSPKTRGTPRGLQGRSPHKKTWQTQKTYLEAPTPPSSLWFAIFLIFWPKKNLFWPYLAGKIS